MRTQASEIRAQAELPTLRGEALMRLMQSLGQPRFRARQIRDWVNKGVLDPERMRNLPAALRAELAARLLCQPLTLVRKLVSRDGTRKYLFRLSRDARPRFIESVFIPEAERGTVCVSTQVGCVLDCPFCHTGTQAFERNLSAAEIVAQVLYVKQDLISDPVPDGLHGQVTHVVYMGMGEPLANERAVHESLECLLDPEGLHLSRRRITVSTSGLVPQIARLGARLPVNLAISLHAAIDDKRNRLVPVNRTFPLERLRACLDDYPLGPQRHITLEYVMLDGVNDTPEDLEALIRFVRPDRERVNLLRFNPHPAASFRPSPEARVNDFARRLISAGVRATVRRSRGQDIMAACGQLKGEQPAGETGEAS